MAHAGGKGVTACVWSAAVGQDGDCLNGAVFFALATGDAAGHVAFWTVDRRARPEKIAELSLEKALGDSHTLACAVTHILAAPTGGPRTSNAEAGFSVPRRPRARTTKAAARRCAPRTCGTSPRPTRSRRGAARQARGRRRASVRVGRAVRRRALGRGGGDADFRRDFISSDATGDVASDADAEPSSSIPFSVVTLGADATLRCHAPPSLGGARRTPRRPAASNRKTAGAGPRRSRSLPVEGVTAEGLAWAREGVLAAVSDKDPSGAVRMFDLESGANYTLRARGERVGRAGSRRRRVFARPGVAAADVRGAPTGTRGALAVGSRDGRVTVFRRVGGSDEDERRNRAGGEKKKVHANDASSASSASRKPSRRGDRLREGRGRGRRGLRAFRRRVFRRKRNRDF